MIRPINRQMEMIKETINDRNLFDRISQWLIIGLSVVIIPWSTWVTVAIFTIRETHAKDIASLPPPEWRNRIVSLEDKTSRCEVTGGRILTAIEHMQKVLEALESLHRTNNTK